MDTLQHRIELAKAQLRLQAPRVVLTMAQTGLALVTLRIQRDGLPGKPRYSSAPFPTYLYWGNALNARGKDYIKKNPLGSWGAFRQAQGLPAEVVNLTYSGRMLRSLTVAPAGTTGTLHSAHVVAADQESANKVQWNEDRYGDFLTPLPAEQQQIDHYATRELTRVIFQALST
jgi:hypothetical protein